MVPRGFEPNQKSENKREGARLAVDMAKEKNKMTKEGVELAMDLAEKIDNNAQ